MKADEIGLPTFEASVSCGQWCQGGSVDMKPTMYAEHTNADEVWVKGEDAAKLAAENAALRQRNEELRQANGWAELEAERDALRKDAERYHRVMQVIRSLCAAKTPELLADLDAAMGEKP